MKEQITEADGVHEQWYEEAEAQTLETLPNFLAKLTTRYGHDYGTITHAIAAAAVAAAWAVERSPTGGISGFQAGVVSWNFLRGWGHVNFPAWLLKGEDMLYPQCREQFTTINAETWTWLRGQAAANLKKNEGAHPDVCAHWQSVVNGIVPFGYGLRQ